jgi:hypothetical protein
VLKKRWIQLLIQSSIRNEKLIFYSDICVINKRFDLTISILFSCWVSRDFINKKFNEILLTLG